MDEGVNYRGVEKWFDVGFILRLELIRMMICRYLRNRRVKDEYKIFGLEN